MSLQVSIVNGTQVGTKSLELPYSNFSTVTYSYTFTKPGNYLIEIYADVDDCKCSSYLRRYKPLNITVEGYCGDGTITSPEQCELPGTLDNANCPQTTASECVGYKLGTRDAFGDCDSNCGCDYDNFNYQCSEQCGAECLTDEDCSGDATCNTATCTCSEQPPECGDGILNDDEECELPEHQTMNTATRQPPQSAWVTNLA
jgi:hypothetical protein